MPLEDVLKAGYWETRQPGDHAFFRVQKDEGAVSRQNEKPEKEPVDTFRSIVGRLSFVCVRPEPFEKGSASLGKPLLELPCAIAIAAGPGLLTVQVAAVSARVRVFHAQ